MRMTEILGACPICRARGVVLYAPAASVTSESKLLPAASELRCCTGCGHLFTSVAVDFSRYYAVEYDSTLSDDGLDEIVSTADGRIVYRTDVDYELMMRLAGKDAGKAAAILEFGCGRGRILGRLARDGYTDLTGYDLSERYREPVSRAIGEPSRVFIGVRPSSRRYDLVCTFFVLEHDVDPVGSLAYLRGVLARHGKLYLMVPSFPSNPVDLACADHVHHFSPRYMRALLAACGF